MSQPQLVCVGFFGEEDFMGLIHTFSRQPLRRTYDRLRRYAWLCPFALLSVSAAQAQALGASAPYTPSAQARHHLQRLADEGGVPLITMQWPLPSAAIEAALKAQVPSSLEASRQFVLRELRAHKQTSLQWLVRTPTESLPGYGDHYSPGSSVAFNTAESHHQVDTPAGALSTAWRLGLRVEQHPNALQGLGDWASTHRRHQVQLQETSLVAAFHGWQLQLRAQPHWWGPGWQSSLVESHNHPVWNSVALQRGSIEAASHPWLQWAGPWNLDVFAAQAHDPLVTLQQPRHFVFSGMRLTLKPASWLELGFSRGLQTGGDGRPGGAKNFLKAFLGQEVNKEVTDTFADSSAQIAGYDLRLTCPASFRSALGGTCSAYTQWMGEDAAGKVPLPFKFMSLWGFEHSWAEGRYRAYAEWLDTNTYSLPWDTKPGFAGYVNGVYGQGYTQGGRWIGSVFGGGARVLTLGWMDADTGLYARIHTGTLRMSPGSYNPSWPDAPRGSISAFSLSRDLAHGALRIRPEIAYMQLGQGQKGGALGRHNLMLGVQVQTRWP